MLNLQNWKESLNCLKIHDSFYDSVRWKRLKEKILRRDKYACQRSIKFKAIPEKAEVVHHIFPRDVFPQYELKEWNLISLSKNGHNKMHDRTNGCLSDEGIELMRRTAMKNKINFEDALVSLLSFYKK